MLQWVYLSSSGIRSAVRSSCILLNENTDALTNQATMAGYVNIAWSYDIMVKIVLIHTIKTKQVLVFHKMEKKIWPFCILHVHGLLHFVVFILLPLFDSNRHLATHFPFNLSRIIFQTSNDFIAGNGRSFLIALKNILKNIPCWP